VEEALASSTLFLVLLSSNSVTALWVRLEYSVMLNLDRAGSGGRIIPILIGDCDPPPLLSVLKWCDLRGENKRSQKSLELLATWVEVALKARNGRATAQTPTTLMEQIVTSSCVRCFPGPMPQKRSLLKIVNE